MVRNFNLSQLIFSVCIVLLMSFFISCGGGSDSDSNSGDGSGSVSLVSLEGEYGMVSYKSNPGTWERISFSTATFTDSEEHVVYEDLFTSNDDLVNVVITYTAYSDGTMTVIGSEGEVSRGIVSSDRNVATTVNTDFTDDGDVEIGFLIKKSSGMSNASLDGEYVFVSYYNDPWTAYGTITFAGDGTGIYKRLDDSDGGVMPGPESINYDVSADGTLSITIATGEVSHGVVSPDGRILAVANTDTNVLLDPSIGIDIAIKKSSGMSNASLGANYICVNYLRELLPETNESTTYGLLSLDGDGGGFFEQLYTSESALDSLIVEYDVNSDGTGTLSITEPGVGARGIFNSIISADSDVYVSVDTDESDDDIGIAFSIRKQ